MFCAGDLQGGGPDSCQGDSGGPAVAMVHGKATLIGNFIILIDFGRRLLSIYWAKGNFMWCNYIPYILSMFKVSMVSSHPCYKSVPKPKPINLLLNSIQFHIIIFSFSYGEFGDMYGYRNKSLKGYKIKKYNIQRNWLMVYSHSKSGMTDWQCS